MAIPGVRFVPTEDELIVHYLDKKLEGLDYSTKFVVDRDLYGDKSPWELFSDHTDPWQTSKVTDKRNRVRIERAIHVITPLKNASQSRINRLAGCGVWHGEGGPFDIRDDKDKIIGHERRYCFKVTASDSENNTNIPTHGHWIMHEFSSAKKATTRGGGAESSNNYVICKISRDDSKKLKGAPCKRARASSSTCNEQDHSNGLMQRKKLKMNHEEATDDDQSWSSKTLMMVTAGFQDQANVASTSTSYGLPVALNNPEEYYINNNGASTSTTSFSDDHHQYLKPMATDNDNYMSTIPLQTFEYDLEEGDIDKFVFGTTTADQSGERMEVGAGFQSCQPNNVAPPTPLESNSGDGFIHSYETNEDDNFAAELSAILEQVEEEETDHQGSSSSCYGAQLNNNVAPPTPLNTSSSDCSYDTAASCLPANNDTAPTAAEIVQEVKESDDTIQWDMLAVTLNDDSQQHEPQSEYINSTFDWEEIEHILLEEFKGTHGSIDVNDYLDWNNWNLDV